MVSGGRNGGGGGGGTSAPHQKKKRGKKAFQGVFAATSLWKDRSTPWNSLTRRDKTVDINVHIRKKEAHAGSSITAESGTAVGARAARRCRAAAKAVMSDGPNVKTLINTDCGLVPLKSLAQKIWQESRWGRDWGQMHLIRSTREPVHGSVSSKVTKITESK